MAADPDPRVPGAGLPVGVARLDAAGRVLRANAAMGAMLGRDAAALVGEALDTLLTLPSRILWQSHVLPLLRLRGDVAEIALGLRGSDALPVDVLLYASVSGGEVDVVFAPVRERRRLEEEMLHVRRAADLAPGMIFQLRVPADGSRPSFRYASEAVRTLYGVSAEAARADAAAVLDLVHADDRHEMLQRMQAAAAAGTPWRALVRVLQPGRPVAWHELHANARPLAGGGVLWHGHIADVTQRLALEQALARQHAADEAARARSAFLARVSHELRTPLNGVLGFAQLLAREGADNLRDEQRRRIATIESAGRTLLELVDEVLDLNALQSGQFRVHSEPVDLHDAALEALDLIGPQAERAGIALRRELPRDAGVVRGDRRRVVQVLLALLSNAVKYNRPGGQVLLRLRPAAAELGLTVADTGPGLTEAQRAGLFQAFNRLGAERSETPGSGLGLVIAQHLLQLMQGRIDVASQPGQGTEFTMWLPRTAEAAASATSEAPPAAEALATADGLRGRVLYVEDNEVNAVLMQAICRLRPGVVLDLASDGAAALAAAAASPPDLVLLDLHLPDIDGYELLRRWRDSPALRRVPVVVVSASAHAEEVERARRSGCHAFLPKPLDIDRTLAMLDGLLARAPG